MTISSGVKAAVMPNEVKAAILPGGVEAFYICPECLDSATNNPANQQPRSGLITVANERLSNLSQPLSGWFILRYGLLNKPTAPRLLRVLAFLASYIKPTAPRFNHLISILLESAKAIVIAPYGLFFGLLPWYDKKLRR